MAEIKWYKAQCEVKDEIIDQKNTEINKLQAMCATNAELVKQKLAEIEWYKAELKAKNAAIDQAADENNKLQAMCAKKQLAAIERLAAKFTANDDIIDQAAENEFHRFKSKANADTIKPPTNYRCPKCSKYFNKKSSLDDHLTETSCAGEKKLDWKCEICKKMYTYRGLTRHLSQFVTNKHIPRGEHGQFSVEQHQSLLNKHKSQSKIN